MIFVQKDKEPDEIVAWKKKFKNKYKRKPHYEDIKSEPEKQQLKAALCHRVQIMIYHWNIRICMRPVKGKIVI